MLVKLFFKEVFNLKKYELLNSPITINGVEFRNRIIMPAMGTGMASINGEVTPNLIKYYADRASGGAGGIIVEIACVDAPVGKASLTQLRIDKPEYIAGLKELSENIQAYGAKAIVQLHHAGRQTSPGITGQAPVAPSPIACRLMRAEPEVLALEGIKKVRNDFVKAAMFASKAGFDGVELHAAHGYLLSQFLSPYSNRRNDDYGGSTENRARLITEIISDIKNLLPELLLSVRFNVMDFVKDGLEIDEGLEIAKLLEAAGADLLDVSSGIYESGQTSIETPSFNPGWRIDLVAQVKEVVDIPTIGGGVIREPELANEVIALGKTDLVWVGRAMLADPQWACKTFNNRADRIRPCITCNTCINQINNALHIRCAVNPRTGREYLFDRNINLINFKVLIIGGGPAGIEAALNLDRAGARVVLVEAQNKLGGMLDIADKPPLKHDITKIKDYLINEIYHSRVDIRLGQFGDLDLIEELAPDVVVWATGARDILPEIKGLETADVISIKEVLSGDLKVENKEILVIGGGSTGCEVAEFLQKNNLVTIAEKEKALAVDIETMTRLELLQRLKINGVTRLLGVEVVEVNNRQVMFNKFQENQYTNLEFDKIVCATGYYRNDIIDTSHLDFVKRVYVIGDNRRPKNIMQALYDGMMVAYDLAASCLN